MQGAIPICDQPATVIIIFENVAFNDLRAWGTKSGADEIII